MRKFIIFLLMVVAAFGGQMLYKNNLNIFQGAESIICEKAYGDMVFLVKVGESIRIKENGDFLVNGEYTANNMEIYEGFREYFTENKGDLRVIK